MNSIIKILKSALGTENVDENTTKENCEEWDSFNHLVVISDLERELQMEFTIQETEQMNSIKDILRIVESKSA